VTCTLGQFLAKKSGFKSSLESLFSEAWNLPLALLKKRQKAPFIQYFMIDYFALGATWLSWHKEIRSAPRFAQARSGHPSKASHD
jgi:hypothetical protein